MNHLKDQIIEVESKIFNCDKCKELSDLRKEKLCNCPVLGFDFDHYVNSSVCSICEAPGTYKPKKGEIFIHKLSDFHSIYDYRIKTQALIGKRLISIFNIANLSWSDIQHFNTICCSPPNYRKPTEIEATNCIPFLFDRIKLMQKLKVIITFGSVAKAAILQSKFDVPIITTYHPSYIFTYMSKEKRQIEINRIADRLKSIL